MDLHDSTEREATRWARYHSYDIVPPLKITPLISLIKCWLFLFLSFAITGVNASELDEVVVPECKVPECPEMEVTYKPDYPPLGEYSVTNVCEAVHDDSSPKVVLQDGERLGDALKRLNALSRRSGGVIEIPWDARLVQCDSTRITGKNVPRGDLTIRGLVGPNGEQPRFYCRATWHKEGTIPEDQVPGYWIEHLGGKTGVTTVVENLHIDGYRKIYKLSSQGNYVVRNSYLHHGSQDGINNVNNGRASGIRDLDIAGSFVFEMCGSEVAHNGQGNFKHGLYMHRMLGGGAGNTDLMKIGGFPTWAKMVLVDNLLHTNNWSSCFKSIANENYIVNNTFYQKLVTDPTYQVEGRTSQMLIDVASCATNEIRGNRLYGFKDIPNEGGSALMGVRHRVTAIRGCDVPQMWMPYQKPPKPVNDWAHSEEYWGAMKGKIFFPTVISDNTFSVQGEYAARQTAIEVGGTYPSYSFGTNSNCFPNVPESWYERSRTYTSNNTYIGFKDIGKVYKPFTRTHNPKGDCDISQPTGPGPSSDLIEIGEGEKYRFLLPN